MAGVGVDMAGIGVDMAGVGVDRGCCLGQGYTLDVAGGRSRDEPWMWLALGVGMYPGCGWG